MDLRIELSDAETTSLYLAHENVSADKLLSAYVNKDFSKLDNALKLAEKKLASVFSGG